MGPAIENGFYYDFEFKTPIGFDDLPKIEDKMRKLIKRNLFLKKSLFPKKKQKIFSKINHIN